jgi:hypothetical protein
MANHVNTFIDIRGLTDKGETLLKQMFSEYFDDPMTNSDAGQVFEEREETREWYLNNLYSKWCTLEDVEIYDGCANILTCSAWSYPEGFVVHILERLCEVQEETITTFVTYEDEMPNFIGCEVYVDAICEDGVQFEDEEIEEMYIQHSSDYSEIYNEIKRLEEDDGDTDELYDKLYDIKFELSGEIFAEEYEKVFSDYR